MHACEPRQASVTSRTCPSYVAQQQPIAPASLALHSLRERSCTHSCKRGPVSPPHAPCAPELARPGPCRRPRGRRHEGARLSARRTRRRPSQRDRAATQRPERWTSSRRWTPPAVSGASLLRAGKRRGELGGAGSGLEVSQIAGNRYHLLCCCSNGCPHAWHAPCAQSAPSAAPRQPLQAAPTGALGRARAPVSRAASSPKGASLSSGPSMPPRTALAAPARPPSREAAPADAACACSWACRVGVGGLQGVHEAAEGVGWRASSKAG